MGRKILSLLLTAAVLLTMTPIIAQAEDSESVVYTQDFEDANAGESVKNFSSQKGQALDASAAYRQEAYEDGSGHYGKFINAVAQGTRVGFKFSEEGISEGTLHVSFKFRKGENSDPNGATVLIGNEDTTTSEWLTLLHICTDGAVNIASVDNNNALFRICDKNGEQLMLDADKWYNYDAKLNLNTRSMDVTVTGNDAVGSVSLRELDRQTGSGDPFKKWPKETKIKEIATIYRPIEMDDIVISRPAFKADNLTYLTPAGEKHAEASFETDRGVLHFTQAAAKVDSGAVTVNGENCTGGELSADGMSYTFNLPSPLTPARYTVVADPALITPKDTSIPVGGVSEFQFIIEAHQSDPTIYTQDFEDENVGESVKHFNINIPSPESGAAAFERKAYDNASGHYGVFKDITSPSTARRVGFVFSESGITEGTIHVSFKFRAGDASSGSFTNESGMVVIGNEDMTTSEWLTLLHIRTGGAVNVASADNSNALFRICDKNGEQLILDADKWYTYDAKLNLNTRSMDVTVTGNGAVGSVSLRELERQTGSGDAFKNWPKETKIKAIGTAYRPIEMDDIKIEYDSVAITDLVYLNDAGQENTYATTETKALRLKFSSSVMESSLAGKITLDGKRCLGTLSKDGLMYDIALSETLAQGSTHTLRAAEGVEAINPDIPLSSAWSKEFIVRDALIIFSEDYEGENAAPYQDFVGSGGKCTVTDDGTGNHYGKIDSNNYYRGGYSFPMITSGKVRIKFDYMFDHVSLVDDAETGATVTAFVRFGHEYGAVGRYLNDPLTLLARNGSEMLFSQSARTPDPSFLLGSVSKNVWYSYDAILDLDTRTIDITAQTNRGQVHVVKEVPLRQNTDTTSATGSGNMWANWPNLNTFDQLTFVRKINIDNILISRYYAAPELMEADITLLKAGGKEETDLTKVDPAVNKIKLNFGEEMRAESINSQTLSLTAADSTAVEYTGSLDESGKAYIMEFNGLNGNMAYTLTVSGRVANVMGTAMGKDAQLTFTTGKGGLSGRIDSVSAGGAKVGSLAALAGTAQVSVTVPNSSDKEQTAVVYLAYYDQNNKILDIKEQHFTAPAGRTTAQTLSFAVSKPEGTACAKFLLWTGDDAPLQIQLELQ